MDLFKLFGTIAIKNDEANKALDETTNKAEHSSSKIEGTLKKLIGVVTAAFAIDKIKDFGAACIEAYEVQETSELKLETIMKQRMHSSDAAIQSVKDLTSAQQQLGVVGDEVQLSGAQQLATFLNTESALKTLIPAMNDLAVQQNGYNVSTGDMVNIGNLMGKVMQGQTAALTRVGVTFTEAQEKVLKFGTEEERAAMLAQVITDNVGHMNSVMAQTDSGQIQQAKNNFGDMQEMIGQQLLPVVAIFYGMVNDFALFVMKYVIPVLSEVSGFIQRHETAMKILITVVAALTAGLIAYVAALTLKKAMEGLAIIQTGLMTAAETAYSIAAGVATVATTALSLAMSLLTSPVTMVIVALAAVVAACYLLAKNWDTIVEKLKEVQQAFIAVWEAIQEKVLTVINTIKSLVFDGITTIKNSMINGLDTAKSTVFRILDAIRNKFQSIIENAMNVVRNGIERIKSFFNFEWSLPHLKLPHFNISGNFSLNPPSVPKFNIDWYKKAMDDGMIMNQPTIFGYNQDTNQLMAGGEAGSETVVGTESLLEMIHNAVSAENGKVEEKLERLLSILGDFFPEVLQAMERPVILDSGVLVGEMAPGLDIELGKLSRRRERG